MRCTEAGRGGRSVWGGEGWRRRGGAEEMEKAVTFSVVVGTYSLGHWGVTANPPTHPPIFIYTVQSSWMDQNICLAGWDFLLGSLWPVNGLIPPCQNRQDARHDALFHSLIIYGFKFKSFHLYWNWRHIEPILEIANYFIFHLQKTPAALRWHQVWYVY